MLVTFNPRLTGSDQRTWAVNFMKCVKAIATAPANSTPSVMGMTDAGGVSTTELITAVIANTEAGGWTASTSDTVPTTTWSMSTNTYRVDLYVRNTGKSVLPYHKYCLVINPSHPFTSDYSSFPKLFCLYGAADTTTYDNGSLNGYSGAWLNFDSDGRYGSWSHETNYCFRPDMGSVTIAATENYIHMINTNYSVSGWLSFAGYRETQAWEDNFDDNPPVFGCSINNLNNAAYPNTSFTYWRSINNYGQYNSPYRAYLNNPGYYNYAYGGYSNNYVTWQGDGQYGTETRSDIGRQQGIALPLFQLTCHGGGVIYPPTSDSSTGALVPCAYPIIISTFASGGFNLGGALKGVYKSLSNNGVYDSTMFYSPGATYTINGDPYYPVPFGNNQYDLFLLRCK